MMTSRAALVLVGSLLLAPLSLGSLGCTEKKDSALQPAHAKDPAPIDDQECASCGMLVRDQPAPRAQLIHRDGTQEFFCSVSDMLVYLDAPSPHGKAVSLFVESMDEEEPAKGEARPWLDARSAVYVTGIEREKVMGQPILSYSSREKASGSAARHAGTEVSWSNLRAALDKPQHH